MEDPICGRLLSPEDAPLRLDDGGQALFFCSVECMSRHRFRANTDRLAT